MGILFSKHEIGKQADGRSIYETDLQQIDEWISDGTLSLAQTNDRVKWGTVSRAGSTQVLYARSPSVIARRGDWLRQHSEDVSTKLMAAAGISGKFAKPFVAQALKVLIPYMARGSRQAANAAIMSIPQFRKHQDAISRMLDELEASLSKVAVAQVDEIFSSEYLTPSDQARLKQIAEQFEGKLGAGEGYSGGCGCGWMGAAEIGTDTITKYVNSTNAVMKEKLVDEILAIAAGLGLRVTGQDTNEKVRALVAAIPHGKGLGATSADQEKICKAIAHKINEVHGSSVIDISAEPAVICHQVAEIVHSLMAGMHTEFLSIYNETRTVLRNLHILRKALSDDYRLIETKIKASNDPDLTAKLNLHQELHNAVLVEIDRQLELLQNLLNVTLAPADRDLSILIKKRTDIPGVITKIDYKLGTDKFGKMLADIMRGLGFTSQTALLVNNALKTVGITVDEYTKTNSVRELREKITKNLLAKKLNEAETHDFLEAADYLRSQFASVQSPERRKALLEAEKSGAGDDDLYDDFYDNDNIGDSDVTGAHHDATHGVTHGAAEYAKSPAQKALEERRRVRSAVFDLFFRQLNDIYEKMVVTLNALTSKVGREVPLSDQLDNMRYLLTRIDNTLVKSKDIYYALTGYYNDALSKEKRESMLGNLRMISGYIDTITEMSIYQQSKQYFLDLQLSIKAIIDLVEKFSEEVAARYGRGELPDASAERMGAGEDSDDLGDERLGGFLSIKEPGSMVQIKSPRRLSEALRNFDYNYRAAQIRSNMARSAVSLEEYGAKYNEFMASSIANLLDGEQKKYDNLVKAIGADEKVLGSDYKEELRQARAFLDAQWQAKLNFWRTVEAIDLYMKAFTDGLVKNPNDIKDIKSMLDDVEVISAWYNDRSGNLFADVFEYFPSKHIRVAGNDDAIELKDDKTHENIVAGSYHYYNALLDGYNGADADLDKRTPGNPYLVTKPSDGMKARERMGRALREFSLLKNLISVFVHIGGKFGGEEIRKKVTLSPAQIYNNLLQYIQASAFAQGFNAGSDEITVKDGNITGPKSTSGADRWNMLHDTSMVLNPVDNKTDKTAVPMAPINSYGVNGGIVGDGVYTSSGGVVIGVGNIGSLDVPATFDNSDEHKRMKQLQVRHHWGVWMRSIITGLREAEGFGFKIEDDYFVLVMKAIAAKVLTVTGMYDVFDRPAESNSVSPIRMIVGGDDSVPKVDAEATELYFRLPYLLEFYRDFFAWSGEAQAYESYVIDSTSPKKYYTEFPHVNSESLKIAMVPEIEGVYSGLIKAIFRKGANISISAMTDQELAGIVREVNLLYQRIKAKHGDKVTDEAIRGLVDEVNRRFAVVSLQERNEYEYDFAHAYTYANGVGALQDRYGQTVEENIAILPGEGEEEVSRPAMFEQRMTKHLQPLGKKEQVKITDKHRLMLYRFRCHLDKVFRKTEEAEEYTFRHAIRGAQLKLQHETNDAARFKIVCTLLRGTDAHATVDSAKYLLFHDTVIAGLNALSAIHTLLYRFKATVYAIDLQRLERVILDEIAKDQAQLDVTQDVLRNAIKKHLKDCGVIAQGIPAIIERILGDGSNLVAHGGSSNNANINVRKNLGLTADINRYGTFNVKKLTEDPVDFYTSLGSKKGSITVTHQADGAVDPTNRHLAGIIAGLPLDQIAKLRAGKLAMNDEARPYVKKYKQRLDLFFGLLFDHEFAMKTLVETVFGFASDMQGLVNVSVEDDRIQINLNGVRELVEALFKDVSFFIDFLRPHMPKDTIDKYTNKFNPGSFYWLQEQLMEKLIVGRPAISAKAKIDNREETLDKIEYRNLTDLSRTVNEIYKYLTREIELSGAGVSATNPFREIANKVKYSYDKVFSELIFYDATRLQSGLVGDGALSATSAPELTDVRDNYGVLLVSGHGAARTVDTRFLFRFKQLYGFDTEHLTYNRSVLFAFNQLVAKYIRQFFDHTQQKMYVRLIDGFANGAYNRQVIDYNYTYPDVAPAIFAEMIKESIPDPTTCTGLRASLVGEYARALPGVDRIYETVMRYGSATDKKIFNRGDTYAQEQINRGYLYNLIGTAAPIHVDYRTQKVVTGKQLRSSVIINKYAVANIIHDFFKLGGINQTHNLHVLPPIMEHGNARPIAQIVSDGPAHCQSNIATALVLAGFWPYLHNIIAKAAENRNIDLAAARGNVSASFSGMIRTLLAYYKGNEEAGRKTTWNGHANTDMYPYPHQTAGALALIAGEVVKNKKAPENLLDIRLAAGNDNTITPITFGHVARWYCDDFDDNGVAKNNGAGPVAVPTLEQICAKLASITDEQWATYMYTFAPVVYGAEVQAANGYPTLTYNLWRRRIYNSAVPPTDANYDAAATVDATRVNAIAQCVADGTIQQVAAGGGGAPRDPTWAELLAAYNVDVGAGRGAGNQGYDEYASAWNKVNELAGGSDKTKPAYIQDADRNAVQYPDTSAASYSTIWDLISGHRSSGIYGASGFDVRRIQDELDANKVLNEKDTIDIVNALELVLRCPKLTHAPGTYSYAITSDAINVFPYAAFVSVDAIERNDWSKLGCFAAFVCSIVSNSPGKSIDNPTEAFTPAIKMLKAPPLALGPQINRIDFTVKYDDYEKRITGVNESAYEQTDMLGGLGKGVLRLVGSDMDRALKKTNALGDLGKGPDGKYINPNQDGYRVAQVKEFGHRWDPHPEKLLFTSLGAVLRNMITNRVPSTSAYVFMLDNIADVPLYMKEKFRSQLPYFRTLFRELISKCELYKRFLGQSRLMVDRQFNQCKPNAVPTRNPWPYSLVDPTTAELAHNDATKRHFTAMLDNIVRGCTAFISGIENVLREVGDDPKYLELSAGSIRDYKNQYGMDPLMPLSSLTAILGNLSVDTVARWLPTGNNGQDNFKFQYGARHILGSPNTALTLDHMPGVLNLLEQFNQVVDARGQLARERLESFAKSFISAMRFVFETKHVKGNLTPLVGNKSHSIETGRTAGGAGARELVAAGMFARGPFVLSERNIYQGARANAPALPDYNNIEDGYPVPTNNIDTSIVDHVYAEHIDAADWKPIKIAKPSYAVCNVLNDTIRLTENSMRSESVKAIIRYFMKDVTTKIPTKILNIIDLNIVPINVHALMREIPLANLYNYAYTFDRLIIELFYGKSSYAETLINRLCMNKHDLNYEASIEPPSSNKDLLVSLLIDPYLNVKGMRDAPAGDKPMKIPKTPFDVYDTHVKGMLIGATDDAHGGLARPRYLSDQLYNKALFGSLYAKKVQAQMNELGPIGARKRSFNNLLDTYRRIVDEFLFGNTPGMYGMLTTKGLFARALANNTRAQAIAAIRSVLMDLVARQLSKQEALHTLAAHIVGTYMGLGQVITPYVVAGAGSETSLATIIALPIVLAGQAIGRLILENIKPKYTRAELDSIQIGIIQTLMTLMLVMPNRFKDNKTAGVAAGADNDFAYIVNLGVDAVPRDVDGAASRYMFDYCANTAGVVASVTKSVFRTINNNAPVSALAAALVNAGDPAHEAVVVINYGGPKDMRLRTVSGTKNDIWHSAGLLADVTAILGASIANASPILINHAIAHNDANAAAAMITTLPVDLIYELVDTLDSGISPPSVSQEVFTTRNLTFIRDANLENKETPDDPLENAFVEEVDVKNDKLASRMYLNGQLRFDTVAVRNQLFTVNLYRALRLKLNKDLVYNKDIVQRSLAITSPMFTEFNGNEYFPQHKDYLEGPSGKVKRYRNRGL